MTSVYIYSYTVFPYIIPGQPFIVVIVCAVSAENGVKVQSDDHPGVSSTFDSIQTEVCSVLSWLCYHTEDCDGGLCATITQSYLDYLQHS